MLPKLLSLWFAAAAFATATPVASPNVEPESLSSLQERAIRVHDYAVCNMWRVRRKDATDRVFNFLHEIENYVGERVCLKLPITLCVAAEVTLSF
jgi:hypothetical protein